MVSEQAAPRLSVIVPVYNALPFLPELLDSLAAQDLNPSSFEVIAVDDGSTDGSGAVLEAFARAHGNVRVMRQDNSGAPGSPRNAGLRASSAQYVLFADADDRIAPEALRRLVTFADEHEADVVIPTLAPLGRRGDPTAVYEKTLVDASLPTAFQTLCAQNLYRRQLLVDHGIRFPEGYMHLEGGVFNAEVYVRARRVSILGDGDCYVQRAREDGLHVSREERLGPASYTDAVSEIVRIVRRHVVDIDTTDQIVLDLYRRQCLHIYHPGRLARYDEATQDAWVAAHQSFAWQFVSDAMEMRLASPFRERSYFVRRGDKAGLLALADVEAAPVVTATLRAARWAHEGIEVLIDASIAGRLGLARQVVCDVLRRDAEGGSAFPVVRRAEDAPDYGQPAQYVGVFPERSIGALIPGTYDVQFTSLLGGERFSACLRWDERLEAPPVRTGCRIYGTRRGQVSIQKSELSLRQALGRVVDTFRLRR